MSVHSAWGVAQKNARREIVCGDAFVTAEQDGRVLWSIVDGAGHGRRAHEVAEEAAGVIRTLAFHHPLERILTDLHRHLRGRRGAAVSLLRLDGSSCHLEFAGVGNVEMRSHGPTRIHPVPSPGILGRALRRVKLFTYQVQVGDFIAMYSDGISSRFSLNGYAALAPEEAARKILENHHKPIDDGTCIVVKISEPAS
jgi:serine phosphatase RsbU (regulator of sigma subunit)